MFTLIRITNALMVNAGMAFIILIAGCAGTVYQPYDGSLGYQESYDSKDRLVITYIAIDSTDWFTIGTFVDKRIAERKAENSCVDYQMVRDVQSEQKVTIQRQQDAQYTTILGMNAEWSIQTHERIDLEIPAMVRVYKRILKPIAQC